LSTFLLTYTETEMKIGCLRISAVRLVCPDKRDAMTSTRLLRLTAFRLWICWVLAIVVGCWITLSTSAAHAASDSLRAYFIDVEGGQATLIVTPAGKSLLIDAGWPEHGGRDADRIAAAAKLAGITKIDYLLLTHFHDDHVGGVPQLVQRMPVGTFIDHGTNREASDAVTVKDFAAYQKVLAAGHYGHIVPKPGDLLPIAGLKAQVISADGDLIKRPLPGGGLPNPYCQASETRPPDQTENARSLGILITFGGEFSTWETSHGTRKCS
jgi:competence protein ComEC